MPDEATQPNTEPAPTPSENQISEVSSIPVSPQEPMAEAPIPPTESTPAEVLPEPPEASTEPQSAVPVKDHISANEPLNSVPEPEISIDQNNPNLTIEKHGNDVTITEVMEPTAQMAQPSPEATAGKQETAHLGASEPLDLAEEIKLKQRQENLKLANQTRQEKKRKKVDAILDLFAKQTNLTNDEVEKLLHVSDATATRYLETLEKEGKIKQVGETGKGVTYEKI